MPVPTLGKIKLANLNLTCPGERYQLRRRSSNSIQFFSAFCRPEVRCSYLTISGNWQTKRYLIDFVSVGGYVEAKARDQNIQQHRYY